MKEKQKRKITQNISPAFHRHPDQRVKDGESHKGDDAGDDEPHAEVDVDDVALVQTQSGRTDAEFNF